MTTVRVVIVEDEGPARRRLRELVDEAPDVECVGEARDATSAVETIDRLRPDVVFLDVRLPGGTGLDVLDRLDHRPRVIFTTAHDRYAVSAFELQALDYLLKPFGDARFREALQRARAALDAARSPDPAERLRAGLSDGSMRRLYVRDRGRILPLAVDDVVRIEAWDDYCRVYAAGDRFLVDVRMKEFEARLPESFLRVHRGHIVNLDHVVAFHPADGGRLEVEIDDGTRVLASRRRSREMRKLTV